MPSPTLLTAHGLTKSYVKRRDVFGRASERVHALRGVDLEIAEHETVAIVGESGSGKSTLGRLLLHLEPPDSGTVRFRGVALGSLGARALRNWRREAQMVFQNPFLALDPRMSIAAAVEEPLVLHTDMSASSRAQRAHELLAQVGISDRQAERFPAEFSGGQLQRVVIARALASEPSLIVCDEPVAALDMSVRAQVLNLLGDLQQEHGLAMVFITHDLSLIRALGSRVAVMFDGRIIESGSSAEIISDPQHPYTKALVAAIPQPDPRLYKADGAGPVAGGEADSVATNADAPGCSYASRCPAVTDVCRQTSPPLVRIGTRMLACHVATGGAAAHDDETGSPC